MQNQMRHGFRFCLVVAVSTLMLLSRVDAGPRELIDALLAKATAERDAPAVRRLTNLKNALAAVRPSQLKGIDCGNDVAAIAFNSEGAIDVVGSLLEPALEKYLPTLAAALASAPVAGAVLLLTPERIAPDAVEILNDSASRPSSEVRSAARVLLQDTKTDAFTKLPLQQRAKIVACAL